MAQPERAGDRAHRLHRVLSIPMPHNPDAFAERFGITELATGYGSTEAPACIIAHPGTGSPPTSCGQAARGLRDPAGRRQRRRGARTVKAAEAMVRSTLPWMMSQGLARTDAEANPWRPWRQTAGSTAATCCAATKRGRLYFVDRGKDSHGGTGAARTSPRSSSRRRCWPSRRREAACVRPRSGCAEQFDDEVKGLGGAEAGRRARAPRPRCCGSVPRCRLHGAPLPRGESTGAPKTRRPRCRSSLSERGHAGDPGTGTRTGSKVTRDGLVEP